MSLIQFPRRKVYKAIVVGESGVGKTTLLTRHVKDYFEDETTPTVGASCSEIALTQCEFGSKVSVWDTAGQEIFRSMAPLFYRSAIASLILFDVTDRQTFDQIHGWIKDVRAHSGCETLLFLVGTKCDQSDREVSEKEAIARAQRVGAVCYTETSAFTGQGIRELFSRLVKEIYEYSRKEEEMRSKIEEETKCIGLSDEIIKKGKKRCC